MNSAMMTVRFLPSLAVFFLCPVGAFAMEVVAGAKAATSSPGAESENVRCLFDRRIEWADGSVERVQVGGDMFFRLDGRKVRIGGADSLCQWATRWCAVMTNYPNVVAVAAENELDIPMKPPAVPAPQQYTAANAAAYMKLLTGVVRSQMRVPVVTKLCGEVNASWSWRPDIKEAVLPFSDTPCLDLYFPTVPELNSHLDVALTWLKQKGCKTNGFWVAEANAGTGNAPWSADFSVAHLESMFARGASVVCLWVANCARNPSCAFFDAGGNPGAPLLRIAPHIRKLQAPIGE